MTNRHVLATFLLVSLVIAAPARSAPAARPQSDPPPPPSVTGNKFSMVLLPDTQAYSEDYDLSPTSTSVGNRYAQRFYDQTNWIATNAQLYKICFVSHVGDVVQNFNQNNASEWTVARTALNMLHPGNDPRNPPFVPYAVSLGNHDFDHSSLSNLWATKFVSEYGANRFKNAQGQFHSFYKGSDLGWKYFVGPALVETGRGYNSYQVFNAGSYTFLHISLQCAATNGSIAWAQTVLDSHPGMRTILTTHAFITGGEHNLGLPGELVLDVDMGRRRAGVTNDATSIWNKLIRGRNQIFMIFCGHTWEQEHIVLHNDAGNPVLVYEASFTIQKNGGKIRQGDCPSPPWAYTGPDDDDRNGSGWLGLLLFDPDANDVTWFTYSPTLDVWATDRRITSYPPTMTTYPLDYDVIIRTGLDLDDVTRFGP